MRKCSICDQIGHYKNNRKYHTKQEIEEYDNKVLARMIVGNIFRNIIKANNKMDYQSTNDIIDIIHKNKCILFENTIFNSSDTEIGYWYEDGHVKDKDKKIVDDINSLFKRKNTDNQCTELITALILLGLKSSDFDYDKIILLSNAMFRNGRLKCKKESLNKYQYDLKISIEKKTIKNSYIDNFIKTNFEIDIGEVDYVYLTGKSFSEIKEIKDLNKDYKTIKPNSDVYFKLKNGELCGISCKNNPKCPLTNKISEGHMNVDERNHFIDLRKEVLKDNGLTIENWNTKKSNLFNKSFYGDNKYWDELIKYIINNKKNYIKDVLYSTAQGHYLKYKVYEYNGEKIENTNQRYYDINKCNIKKSKIFYYCNKGKRQDAKAYLDFMVDSNIIYKLEIRFKIGSNKKSYFMKGGSPQTFIYKPTKNEIEDSTRNYEKFINNSSLPILS